jgi:peroxiredoxin
MTLTTIKAAAIPDHRVMRRQFQSRPARTRREEKQMSQILAAGTVAPDFKLRVTPDQWLSLSDLSGRPAILAFYPADWSPVCGDQMTLYNEILPEFRKQGAELLGISVDGAWCHEAFVKDRRLHFPLLADFHPKGEVARNYGAYREQDGVCERALFVVDRKRMIFWSYCSPIAVNPGADGILAALDRLSNDRKSDDGHPKSSNYAA